MVIGQDGDISDPTSFPSPNSFPSDVEVYPAVKLVSFICDNFIIIFAPICTYDVAFSVSHYPYFRLHFVFK